MADTDTLDPNAAPPALPPPPDPPPVAAAPEPPPEPEQLGRAVLGAIVALDDWMQSVPHTSPQLDAVRRLHEHAAMLRRELEH